ncbi:TetR/AcrR family transcriptional regulator [Nocardiopsis chromatogenes]|uniref:TetR/AcrR family transcriptional regulator n=1 Tax=Nocardiopsis chromatogenes TaxID=280239 RepID=UPI00034495CB|nr:TetR/AcrR family transcriptional regulator [Nocardiopsis chromatogenes]
MSGHPPEDAGPTRRRRRLSDTETERRMLRAAVEQVNGAGLTVGLDHISFEDVIRDAGVSRSAVYRRWPYKDLFFSDLLLELARGASPAVGGSNPEAVRGVERTVLEHLDRLRVPSQRVGVAAEVLRRGAPRELETFLNSPEWRTYLALHATFLSLPESGFRERVRLALAESERRFASRLAAFYEQCAALLGLRLRPGLGAGFEALAAIAGATVRGMVVMAPTTPVLSSQTVHTDALGVPGGTDWSLPALALASVATAFLEPDPRVEFDDARIEEVRRVLTEGGGLLDGADTGDAGEAGPGADDEG